MITSKSNNSRLQLANTPSHAITRAKLAFQVNSRPNTRLRIAKLLKYAHVLVTSPNCKQNVHSFKQTCNSATKIMGRLLLHFALISLFTRNTHTQAPVFIFSMLRLCICCAVFWSFHSGDVFTRVVKYETNLSRCVHEKPRVFS